MEKVKDIFSKIVNWVKAHLIPVVAVIAAILVIIIVASLFIKTPKKVVKAYIKAFNSGNASKIVKLTDLKAERVLGYVNKDFDKDDYKKFKEKYSEYDEEIDKKDVKDNLEDMFDEMKDEFKTYKIKLKEIKDVDKITKDFAIVRARVHIEAKPKDKDEDEVSATSTVYFAVYKNKIASGMTSMF